MIHLASQFWNDSTGATAVEYAIMAGLIAAVIASAVAAFGGAVLGLFDKEELKNAFAGN